MSLARQTIQRQHDCVDPDEDTIVIQDRAPYILGDFPAAGVVGFEYTKQRPAACPEPRRY